MHRNSLNVRKVAGERLEARRREMGRGWERSRRALKRELIHCSEAVLAWVMMVWQKGKE